VRPLARWVLLTLAAPLTVFVWLMTNPGVNHTWSSAS
jgi:hypothetical protein